MRSLSRALGLSLLIKPEEVPYMSLRTHTDRVREKLIDLEACEARTLGALAAVSVPRRVSVHLLCLLFRGVFWRRWRLSIEHARLTLAPEQPERLARYALQHLALTATGALKRVFTRQLKRELHQESRPLSEHIKALRDRGVRVVGEAHLNQALSSTRGVMIISAHLGAWEELVELGSWLDRPVWVISKRFKTGLAQYLWDRSRQDSPPRLDRGPRARAAKRALKSGAIVADVLDQHDPRTGASRLLFLGRPAWTSNDPARLALVGDALLLPLFLTRGVSSTDIHSARDHLTRLTLHVGAPIDPKLYKASQDASTMSKDCIHKRCIEWATRRCLTEIEAAIRRTPEQWLWLHRRWKERTRS